MQMKRTLKRIAWFQNQIIAVRASESSPVNYRAAASGFLAEVDRMQLEAREYLSLVPAERVSV